MAVSRGVAGIFLSVLGVAILIIAVVVVASLLGSNAPVRPLIHETIELRVATEPVQKAKLISNLDDMVAQTGNDDLKMQWDRMMQCMPTTCPDDAYLDMVLVTVTAYEQDIPESALLINIIATAKYWGDNDHILEFSKALAMANDQIEELGNKNARKAWQQVIECNGTCPQKNQYFFEVIEAIAQ